MTDEGVPFLPYGRHQIEDDDIAAVVAAPRSSSLTGGPLVGEFERAFAARVGARFAVACATGTAALHMANSALGLGAGDGAIVPTMTFLATANSVRYVGAEVAFADVDSNTGLMRPRDLEAAYSRYKEDCVKAVLPVHLNGQCVDMEAVASFAKRHKLGVIEDACHALGATYRTRSGEQVSVGSCRHSDMTVFSLHPVKAIAMGEGGVVTTNDPHLYDRLLRLRNHGMIRDSARFTESQQALDACGIANPWYYEMPELGFNYRASEIHCALGLSQLAKLDRFLGRRTELAALYDNVLSAHGVPVIPVPRVASVSSGWHLYVVLIDFDTLNVDRATLMRKLNERSIVTQVHYLPVHLQPYYRQRYGEPELPGAIAYYRRCLTLPLFPAMQGADVERVATALGDILT